MKGLGYIPDRKDPRDLSVAHLLGPSAIPRLAAATELDDAVLLILDQQDTPACVGFAVAGAIRARWIYALWQAGVAFEDADIVVPSASWIWWQARQLNGEEASIVGTYIRDAFKRIARLGICPDAYWSSAHPRSIATTPPEQITYRMAWDLRAKAGGVPVQYYRVSSRGDAQIQDVKSSLSGGYPVVFGTQVGAAFMSVRQHTSPIVTLGKKEQSVGGHAMFATGFDENSVHCVNSWGRGRGNSGRYLLAWESVRQWSDVWAIQSAPPIDRVRT